MRRGRAIGAGFISGAVAGLVMTAGMLLLASLFGVATPLAIFGDRLSVFIPADTFLSLMGRVGGYNHMKQLGVGSVIFGQILIGALGGIIYGLAARRRRPGFVFSVVVFILLPLVAVAIFLWPVLGTHYFGLPIGRATAVTFLGLTTAFVFFERTLVLGFHFLTRPTMQVNDQEFSPPMGRRALIFGGLGILIAGGGGAGILRTLYRLATFSYDGLQYKGRVVQGITPNDQFYCVTKNVVDPHVNASLWRLEVSGLGKTRQTYNLERLKALPAVAQETTLMCISHGLDAGLMSNALWKGVPIGMLLNAATPLPGAAKVRLHGVDNYTDTFPLEKAMEPTTLVVYEMNGEPLPHRHGFPARVIVPGYFGEKHVKWITRIEVADADAKGFYETQGWGPDFIVPTRSRFDQQDHESTFKLELARTGGMVGGVVYGGGGA